MSSEFEAEFSSTFESGKAYFEQGNYKDAIKKLDIAHSFKPTHRDTLKLLGASYLNIGAYQLAIAKFKKAIELYSEDKDFYLYLAKAYREEKNYQKETEIYHLLSENIPGFKDSFFFEALSYYREKEFIKIENILSKATQFDPLDDKEINLLIELKNYIAKIQAKLLEKNFSKKTVYWRVVFFPILKKYYFFTESITPECFRNDVRNMLLNIRNLNEIISIIDTCGYTPLLIMSSNQDEYYDIRNQIFKNIDFDIQTEHSSYSVKIEKRFGIIIGDKFQEYIDFFKERSGFADFLELINEIQINTERDINIDVNIFKNYNKADKIEYLKECFIEFSKIKDIIDERYHKLRLSKFKDYEKLKWWFDLLDRNEEILKFSDFMLFVPISIPKILSYVMIRFTPKTKDKLLKIMLNEFKNDAIIDVFKIQAAAPEYLLIMQADSLFEFFEMINSMFDEKGVHVIETKCVLRLWKYENYISPLQPKPIYTFDFKNLTKDNVKEELRPEIICGKLWNESEIINFRKNYKLEENIEISRCKDDLHFEIEYDNKDYNKIINSNSLFDDYIYKISIKLERRDWLKVLIMLKSIPGKKQEVEKRIRENILNIEKNYFSRKYYTVRGLFDYIIYTDWRNLNSLRKFREKMTQYFKDNIIINFRSYIEGRFLSRDPNPQKLKSYDINLLNGIIANSLDLASEKKKRNSGKIDSLRKKFLFLLDNRLINITEKPNFSNYAIEMHIENFVHAFIRFKVRDYEHFVNKWKEMENKLFLLRTFEPLSDPLNFMCIIITTNLRTLFWFIKKLDCYCSFISISLIHKQGFYQKNFSIDEWIHNRCKPCIKALEEFNCDGCKWYAKRRTIPSIYPFTNEKLRECIINFRYPEKDFEECKIAIIKLSLNFDECITYGDLENVYIKNFYKDEIIDKFREALNTGANIILFPELTIPKEEIIEEIIKIIKQGNLKNENGQYPLDQNFLVVAGSLYAKRGSFYFNQAPIITNFYNHPLSKDKNIKRFDAIKCYLSSREKDHNKYYEDRRIYRGNGYIILKNTPFGDIGVVICRDFLESAVIDKIKEKVDILLVPSANKSGEFSDKLSTIAGENYIFIAYANNEYHESKMHDDIKTTGFYGPVRKNSKIQTDAEYWERKIPPKKEKYRIIYQDFDVKELDYYRANRGGLSNDGLWYYPDCSNYKRHNITYHNKLNREFKKARKNMINLFLSINRTKADETSKKFEQYL